MKTLGIIALLLVVVIVFIALLIIIYKNYNGKLSNIKEKLDEAKNEFNDKCKDKHEIVLKFIKNIETKYKIESKSFEEVKNISEDEITSLDTEILLEIFQDAGMINIKTREQDFYQIDLKSEISLADTLHVQKYSEFVELMNTINDYKNKFMSIDI